MNSIATLARHSTLRAFVVAACLGSLLSGCTNSTDPATPQAITGITGPSATVNVAQGFEAKSLITVARSSTFAGVVQLTALGVPQGMVVSFSPSSLNTLSTLSEMTIIALTALSPGAHTFTVRASGEGVESKTATVSVMVTVPSITLAASTAAGNVAQGSTLAVPITITREGGFTGTVGLAAIGLPAGVTATFSPQAIESGATTSTLTFSAPLSSQTGVTNVTVRASAQGLVDKTAPIAVTVVPATTPAILISASPVFLPVDGGAFAESILTLQRFAGFNGAVNVAVDGLPTLLTATTIPFAAGSNTSTLRIDVSEQQMVGNYQLTVRAIGTGVEEASVRLAVQTRPMPQFSLDIDFPAVTITRGANGTIRLRTRRFSDFSVPVAVTVAGLPAGVTTNLPTTVPASSTPPVPPAVFTSQDFNIVIGVAANTAPGVYNLVVRGVAAPFTRELPVTLTVN